MGAIGIEWKILVPQIINFLILFFLLRWLLYRPILKILGDRKTNIETALQKADISNKASIELDIKISEKMEKAKQDALLIINEAKKQAEDASVEINKKARTDAEFLITKAEERIKEQKLEMIRDLRKETINLTIATTEKILGKNIDENIQAKLRSDAILEIETKNKE